MTLLQGFFQIVRLITSLNDFTKSMEAILRYHKISFHGTKTLIRFTKKILLLCVTWPHCMEALLKSLWVFTMISLKTVFYKLKRFSWFNNTVCSSPPVAVRASVLQGGRADQGVHLGPHCHRQGRWSAQPFRPVCPRTSRPQGQEGQGHGKDRLQDIVLHQLTFLTFFLRSYAKYNDNVFRQAAKNWLKK